MNKLEQLLQAARNHGQESEPDHEVGDLQDILRDAWDLIPTHIREELWEKHKEKLSDWMPMSEGQYRLRCGQELKAALDRGLISRSQYRRLQQQTRATIRCEQMEGRAQCLLQQDHDGPHDFRHDTASVWEGPNET